MKVFSDLNLGFADAANYKKNENKELFKMFFVLNESIDKLLSPNTYFLIGGKGTGKTAYSTFLANSEYKNTTARTSFLSETEYKKFIALKNSKNLELSDYSSIWKVLLLLLVSQQVKDGESGFTTMRNYSLYEQLQAAISDFYNNAFSPEIIAAFNIIEKSELAAEVFSKHINLLGKHENSNSIDGSFFQINLLFLERQFKDTIRKLKLSKNHILFIDGIDIRPKSIPYEDYLDCIKGLAHATWDLNNDYFGTIKDSKGRIKVVLLLRPDIYAELGLQNANNKIRDNSVLLDWQTTYPLYRSSSIFKIADRILSVQQEKSLSFELGNCWDYYFPFKNKTRDGEEDSFIPFLRYSLFRPRDIITLMSIIQEFKKNNVNRSGYAVTLSDFDDPTVKSKYSDYLLGEIRDYLSFYHSEDDYDVFLKFFEFLNGKATFTYDEYIDAYEEFGNYVETNDRNIPTYLETSSNFLQFLYDMDIICYFLENEDTTQQIHWSFRERNYSNLNPRIQEGVKYMIHYGLQKALNSRKKYLRRASIKRKAIKK